MWSKADKVYMARALALAKKGKYTTSPNPCVGCVIVKDGKLIAEGYHQCCGQGHAEVNAVANAICDVSGACVYVTLEPCSHYGRTPPCALMLVEKKVSRVVIAIEDPNPLVQGKGIAILKEHGIKVEVGLYRKKAYNLNRAFFKSIVKKLPYVTVKLGMSLDSKIALSNGYSKWITNEKSRSYVQKLRASVDAIITGKKTILADNPSLNVRYHELPFKVKDSLELKTLKQPIKVILDSKAYFVDKLDNFSIFKSGINIIAICSDKDKYTKLNEHVYLLEQKAQDYIDITLLLQFLDTLNVRHVLVESGATLAKSFLDSNNCDELCCFIAPKILGQHAKQAFLTKDLENLAITPSFKLTKLKRLDDDIYIKYQKKVEI